MLSRFDRILKRDEQTDGQTELLYHIDHIWDPLISGKLLELES